MAGGTKIMSRTIDQRIVDMQFNNKQFESRIKESLGSLDRLKKMLDFHQASKNLDNLNAAGRRFSLAGMATNIDHIAGRFNALGIVGMTTIQNLTNAAVNFGKRLISSFTIDPIRTGFQEYETQMNAVQTILANTQGTTQAVNQQAVNAIKRSAETASQAVINSNASSLNSFMGTQRQKTRAFERATKKEIDILQDQQREKEDVLDKKLDDEIDALEKQHDKKEALLEKALEREMDALNESHQQRLDLYEEEFMAKLKVIDEERYLKLKSIDEQIDSIRNLTRAEDEALEKAEDKQRIEELTSRINQTTNIRDRRRAEQALADFKARITRREVLKERDAQIKMLENTKDTIEKEYDFRIDELKKEHEAKIKNAKEQHKEASTLLKEQQVEKINNLKSINAIEKENLAEQHEIVKRNLNERHSIEMDNMRERHQEERDALNARYSSAAGASKRQQAIELKAIEDRKNAELKALTEAAKTGGKATTLEDVTKALDELNLYADKTIYNFTEMARNIGTFTAAGVDLDTSVAAIKGIANLAAVSGSTSHQASMAMYQLSQALSSGTVRLMDWNSVVNAGMGGRVFQEALKETARMHGVEIDKMIIEHGAFRNTLEEGWLTSAVLLDTLAKFTGDLTETQLRAKGYNEEQIISIIKLGQTANDAATKVRTFTQLISTLKEATQSGWTQSWEIIIGDFEEAKELLTGLSNLIGGFIGKSANARNEMLQFWKDNEGRENLIKGLSNVFQNLGKLITPIIAAFRDIFPPITGERLVAMTNSFKEFSENIKIGEPLIDSIRRTFRGLFAVLSIGVELFLAVVNGIASIIKPLFLGENSVFSFTAILGDFIVALEKTIDQGEIFSKIIDGIASVISTALNIIGDGITTVIGLFDSASFGGFLDFINFMRTSLEETMPFFYGISTTLIQIFKTIRDEILSAMNAAGMDSIFDFLDSAFLVGLIVGIKRVIDSLGAVGILEGITGVLDGVQQSLLAYQNSLNAITLLKIAFAIGILALSLVKLAGIDQDRLAAALVAISTLFVQLFAAMFVFQKLMLGAGLLAMMKVTSVLIKMSIAVFILASAMEKLGKMSPEQINASLIAILGLLAGLIGVVKLLGKGSSVMLKGSTKLIILAIAVTVLTTAIKKLSEIPSKDLMRGLMGVLGTVAILVGFLKTTNIKGGGILQSAGLLILAKAINVLADAVIKFASLSTAGLIKGLAALGITLTQISIFTKTIGTKKIISTAIGLTILATAMNIFADAIYKMGQLSLGEVAKGLTTMGLALGIISYSMARMPKHMLLQGVALLAISTSLTMLATALRMFGEMSLVDISKGLLALAGSLGIIIISLKAMTKGLIGAAALLVIAFALDVLALALSVIGSLSIGGIGASLLALAGIFVILGAAGVILLPIIPALLALSAALLILGVGVAAIGGGILLLSTGLSALAVAGTAGAAALVIVITTIIGLIPMFFQQIGIALISIGNIILKALPVIVDVITKVLLAIIQVIVDIIPKFVEGVITLITSLLETLALNVPKMVTAGIELILGILTGISKHIKDVVKVGIKIIVEFLKGITAKLPDVIDAAFKLIIAFINGLASAIRGNAVPIFNACKNLVDAIIDAIISLLGRFTFIGSDMIRGIITGVRNMGGALTKAVGDVVGDSIEDLKGLLGIKSPSTVFASLGVDSMKGFISGLEGMIKKVSSTTKKIGDEAITSISNVIGDISKSLNDDMLMHPVIRPVIDMSNVTDGIKQAFTKQQTIDISGSYSKIPNVNLPNKIYEEHGQSALRSGNIDSSKIFITNNFTVRNDTDIRKISNELRGILDRHHYAKGVMVR